MFFPESMMKVTLVSLKSVKDELILAIGKAGCLHVTPLDKLRLSQFKSIPENPDLPKYLSITAKVKRLIEEYKRITGEEHREDLEMDPRYREINNALEYVDEANQNLNEIIKRYDKVLDELKGLEEQKESIDLLIQHGVDPRSLVKVEGRVAKVGLISNRQVPLLRYYLKDIETIKFNLKYTKTVESLLTIVYPEKLKDWTERLLKQLGFKELKLPGTLEDSLESMRGKIEGEIKEREEELKEISKDFKEKFKQFPFIKSIGKFYEDLHKIETVKREAGETKFLFAVQGWAPKSALNKLEGKIKEVADDKFIMVVEKPRHEEKPPVRLSNPRIFKPFEYITNMYGIPDYNAMDPTIISAVLLPLMFGMMFGDFGQGIVLFLAGLLATRFKGESMKSLGKILMVCGVLASIFGLIYGESFLMHFGHPVIEPLKDVMDLLVISLWFGVAQIVFGLAINIYVSLKNREFIEGFLGEKGLAALITYFSGVYLVASFGTDFSKWSKGLTIILIQLL